ncbi:hypothetical protein HanRHA438_Chr04g0151451 [Helianthus annuus]|nr:hypothetical protein HanHA300_Chr04g0115971 [Helianthus annuus]KAJ0586397.1 hypothetical protein HanIR_Chr04g0151471 [Helianthus annuus]KAJ0924702.1 hypothetical protein HanRHA438_Chr04g0151451 [Helianthus annuus]
MNPELGLNAEEADAFVSSPPRSSEPTPVVSSAAETPVVASQEPPRSIASTICATTSQFSQMQQDEKVDFQFSQLQAAAGQINRQSDVINIIRGDMVKQQLEINTLKSTVGRQQAEITRQQAEIDQLKAENERLKKADEERERQLQQMRAADNTRGIEMNRLKERSTQVQRLAESLKEKHDDMREWKCYRKRMMILRIRGTLTLLPQQSKPPATASTQMVVLQPSQLESTQGTSSGSIEEVQQLESNTFIESSKAGTSSVPSTADLALQVIHPITSEILEEGEIISDLSHEQLLALNAMKEVDDVTIDQMASEPETANVENIEEIVFEGETNKSTYVCADGMEFDPFDEEWMNENREEIDEQLKNRTSSDNPPDSFQERRKRFLLKVEKPTPLETQVDFLQFEKVKPHGKILSWMFVKEIHCVTIKREYGIQYFNSMLSILSLPFYDIASLSKLEIINRSNYFGATLFARKIKFERKKGWKDESYKPQFPIYQQIKFTLDPLTNTARYKLIYQPKKVMNKIPLMPME